MSASEKLEALGAEDRLSTEYSSRQAGEAVLSALPQIVAAVKALEADYRETEHHRRCDSRQGKDCDCYMQRRGYVALAELEKALP